MRLPRLSRSTRRRARRILSAGAWLGTLGVAGAGLSLLVAWDESRRPPGFGTPSAAAFHTVVGSTEVQLATAVIPGEQSAQIGRAGASTAPIPAGAGESGLPLHLAAPQPAAPPLAVVRGAPDPLDRAIVAPDRPPMPSEDGPAASYEEPGVPAMAPETVPVLPAPTVLPGVRKQLFPQRLSGPTVAIVIDDVGYDPQAVHELMAIGRPLTLAFLPFGTDVEPAGAAAAAGLEVIVHMPMQPVGHDNPGPGAIRVGMSEGEIESLVDAALKRVPQASGLNNHMGSKATADANTIQPVMTELAGRELFFLDSRTSGRSVAQAAALAAGVPAIGRDVFLDNDPSVAAVTAQLLATERIARGRGYAVAIGHPHAGTIQALRNWFGQAADRGIQFTTLNRLVPIDTCNHATPTMAFVCAEPGEPARVAHAETPRGR